MLTLGKKSMKKNRHLKNIYGQPDPRIAATASVLIKEKNENAKSKIFFHPFKNQQFQQ